MVEPPQIHDGNRRERLARAGVGGGGVRGGGGGGGGGNGVGSVLHEMQGQTGDGEPGEGITAGLMSSSIGSYALQAPVAQFQRQQPPQLFTLPGQMHGVASVVSDGQGANFSLGAMAAALPGYRLPAFDPSPGHPQFHPSHSPTTMRQNQQQSSYFAGQSGYNSQAYNLGLSSHLPPYLQAQQESNQYSQQQHQQHHGQHSPMQQQYPGLPFYGGQQLASPQYALFPPYYRPINPSPPDFQGVQRQQEGGAMGGMSGNYGTQGAISPGAPVTLAFPGGGQYNRAGTVAGTRPTAPPAGPIPSAPRGPPRKPKQSGHALWVGNLPPGTVVTDLKDHFAREATTEIESVFLISKSNCAFVNYRSEEACTAAMTRFHDSRFQGVRLVCRLRRSVAAPTPGVPTGPAALTPTASQAQTAVEAISQNREISSKAEETARQTDGVGKINDKYFIVKSLTVEDLELSARNGIWATQAHNEEAFNKAYELVENVYLIFSGNKSGEYFGYARMASPINEEAAAKLDWTPSTAAVAEDPELPRSIPTPATEFAPKGRIIDDSARGTIFWEADPISRGHSPILDGQADDDKSEKDMEEEAAVAESSTGAQPFGKPFQIEWLSVNKLPFYRTRGLRNPWNANREVKIARDGTELETSVGRRLVQLFHRSLPGPGIGIPPMGTGGAVMQLGYPMGAMRPY